MWVAVSGVFGISVDGLELRGDCGGFGVLCISLG